MVQDRHTVILYTTATCNLNCRYCYIDKNPALVRIDEMLDESFRGDYYYNFIKEMFPDPGQLTDLQTWGGEPFLRMDRLYHTLHKIIPEYPNLQNFFASSNMAFPEWSSQFFGLMEQFGRYPDRQFNYCLQMSLDGPEEWTDRTRGEGTTWKLLNNFHRMTSMLGDHLPANVHLSLCFKPTLDMDSVRLLNSEKQILKYYSIFDDLVTEVRSLGFCNVSISPGVPNTACPCLATKEDGEFFARLCKMTRAIERKGVLKNYSSITPFDGGARGEIPDTLRYPNFTCGTGYTNVGLLPGNMISACHNGFVDMVGEYKKLASANNGKSTIDTHIFFGESRNRMTMTKEQYAEYEKQMYCFNCPNTSARLSSIATQINVLAYMGQVDPVFRDSEEAIHAAIWYQSHTSFCVRDNHATTGSLTTIHNGMLRLLFNGAYQYIDNKEEYQWVK